MTEIGRTTLNTGPTTLSRRGLLAQAARVAGASIASGAVVEALAACGQQQTASVKLPTGLAAPGTTIPAAHIDWAMAPYPDETIAVVGMKRGYFKDVGITIGPSATGAKIDLSTSLAPLLTNQVQVGSGPLEVFMAELDNTSVTRSFVLLGMFEGLGFFAPPESKAKTIQQFMAEGQPFSQAMRSTMQQMKGKRVALATDPGSRLFYEVCFSLGGIANTDIKRSDLQNPSIVEVALAGNTDFAAPSGGVEIVKLEASNFKTLIDQNTLLTLSTDARRLQLVSHASYVTRADFYDANYDTILRAASVVYRVLDDLKRDHTSTEAVQLPFLNAYTGTTISAAQLAQIHKTIAVMWNFDSQIQFYEDPSSASDVYTDGQAQLDQLYAKKVLKRPHKVAEIEGAKRVWLDLKRYRAAADKLILSVASKDPAIVAKAQAQYRARNYLDAYRFLASIK